MRSFEKANEDADKLIQEMDDRVWAAMVMLAPENTLISTDPIEAKKAGAKRALARACLDAILSK